MNFSDLQGRQRIRGAGTDCRCACERKLRVGRALGVSDWFSSSRSGSAGVTATAQIAHPGAAPPQAQLAASSATPDADAGANRGRVRENAGNYTVQQSIEFGYRDSMIGGNLNNYDTFENLSSGLRLFDYTVNMRSINHQGIFFDNLTFSNFGYGGDPNDVSRLRIEKTSGTIFARCSGATRTSGITICSQIR